MVVCVHVLEDFNVIHFDVVLEHGFGELQDLLPEHLHPQLLEERGAEEEVAVKLSKLVVFLHILGMLGYCQLLCVLVKQVRVVILDVLSSINVLHIDYCIMDVLIHICQLHEGFSAQRIQLSCVVQHFVFSFGLVFIESATRGALRPLG